MSRAKRKWEHMHLALETRNEDFSCFEDITFIQQSLPNTNVDMVKLHSKIGGLSLSSPIFINAMTGGGGSKTLSLNQQLAICAKETNIAIGVGSQMSALVDSTEKSTFQIIRKEYPNGIIFSNLGSEATVEQAKQAVDMLEANALQIHLNTVQELTMPEGDRQFHGALKRIENIVNNISVPVVVKEVGFGMSKETINKLCEVGVQTVDVSGFGGTNFAKIENARRDVQLPFFNEWGIPTTVSIAEAQSTNKQLSIIASGGIQNSLHVAKAIALGANACGLAGKFLKILTEQSTEGLITEITKMKFELSLIMTALGVTTIEELKTAPLIISGRTHHWLTEREISTKTYANR